MQKNYNTTFSGINLSMVEVAELMEIMNVSHTELLNNKKFDRFKVIADFVKDIPNKRRFFTRITKAQKVDMIDFMYEYCLLRLDLESATQKNAENEALLMRSPEDELLLAEKQNLQNELADISSTIDVYEN